MVEIVVAKPFTLSLTHDDIRTFDVGIHRDVSDEVANHWWTQAHLAKDGKLPEAEPVAPLTHEERVAMKATLDDAAERVKAAQAERDSSRAELAKANARIADLTADLDKATKPPETASNKKPAAA